MLFFFVNKTFFPCESFLLSLFKGNLSSQNFYPPKYLCTKDSEHRPVRNISEDNPEANAS